MKAITHEYLYRASIDWARDSEITIEKAVKMPLFWKYLREVVNLYFEKEGARFDNATGKAFTDLLKKGA